MLLANTTTVHLKNMDFFFIKHTAMFKNKGIQGRERLSYLVTFMFFLNISTECTVNCSYNSNIVYTAPEIKKINIFWLATNCFNDV